MRFSLRDTGTAPATVFTYSVASGLYPLQWDVSVATQTPGYGKNTDKQ